LTVVADDARRLVHILQPGVAILVLTPQAEARPEGDAP
jgi:hypothetical protein